VVGVTGSVGKTSTKEAIAGILSRRFVVLKNEKNYNNEIGLPLTLLMLEPRHQVAVLEMGMYTQGEISELCSLALPEMGVVTNVGPTHLERLGTIDRIAEAKSELVQALPMDGLAVLNGDDERVRAMAEKTQAPVVSTGLPNSAMCARQTCSSMAWKAPRLRFTRMGAPGG
jgi:UDP-N-acetylmuramoyl-tripeptide--D-alanyl-D-alanine ligase